MGAQSEVTDTHQDWMAALWLGQFACPVCGRHGAAPSWRVRTSWMVLNDLLCRPGNQPWWGFYACEEVAMWRGSREMELIPRPWGLDLLPLAFTDFDIQESHLIYLFVNHPPCSCWLQNSCSPSSSPTSPPGLWAVGPMHMNLAASPHWLPDPTLLSLRACDLCFGHMPRWEGFPCGCYGLKQQWESAP